MGKQNRQPAGAPAGLGGQFAGGKHDEPVTRLTDSQNERDA